MTATAAPPRAATCRAGNHRIVFDPDCLPAPAPEHFDAGHWQAAGRATPIDEGRGSAWRLHAHTGDWVLRRYMRGGLPGKLVRERYWHVTTAWSRPWREFHITASLHAAGLPVPRPVAACLTRLGPVDTGALITTCIPGAVSLGQAMRDATTTADDWSRIGTVIAAMHAAGVWHADLNVANLLADSQRRWHIIDFDRARWRTGQRWQAGNLQRLRRSVDKLRRLHPATAFDEAHWQALLAGHAAAKP